MFRLVNHMFGMRIILYRTPRYSDLLLVGHFKNSWHWSNGKGLGWCEAYQITEKVKPWCSINRDALSSVLHGKGH